jgi:hypothetical protein
MDHAMYSKTLPQCGSVLIRLAVVLVLVVILVVVLILGTVLIAVLVVVLVLILILIVHGSSSKSFLRPLPQ